MARFHGEIGYGITVESKPGVHKMEIVERKLFGSVERISRKLEAAEEKVNQDIGTTTVINVVADAYAREHYMLIKYVRWEGALWSVKTVDVERPRLKLRLGGLYNANKA